MIIVIPGTLAHKPVKATIRTTTTLPTLLDQEALKEPWGDCGQQRLYSTDTIIINNNNINNIGIGISYTV